MAAFIYVVIENACLTQNFGYAVLFFEKENPKVTKIYMLALNPWIVFRNNVLTKLIR